MANYTIPESQKALKIESAGTIVLRESCPVPSPLADEVLVKVTWVAINPFDAKSADLSPTPDATLGADFAGVVVSVGPEVKRSVAVGDRVCGSVFGNHPDEKENGAFAEFITVAGDLTLTIPDDMSFAEAATLGVAIATSGICLYQAAKLPLPGKGDRPDYVLIYGAGTATATILLQLARLSGLLPIAVCSPTHYDRVKALGAVEVFDYHSPNCSQDILEYTKDSLAYAVDCITNVDSMKLCYAAIGSKGGKYVALDAFPIRGHTRRTVKPDWILGVTIHGKRIPWQKPYKREAKPQDREFAESWFEVAQDLLSRQELICHPYEQGSGGLADVIEGVQLVRTGKVAGKKLVYEVAESV
ncbi:Trans-enoyl reductase lepG [Cladobotryum mycophilum]|uniref:Trans-enoyl reductase lepG n=1 Tax=Cladobotryum mycophilum TaxID=491253 RepID=A0ABR0SH12_9HYPO